MKHYQMTAANDCKTIMINVKINAPQDDRSAQSVISCLTNHHSVAIQFNIINESQANAIFEHAHNINKQLEQMRPKIEELYGQETSSQLFKNIDAILDCSCKVLQHSDDDSYSNFFRTLSLFCGEVEQILSLLQAYKKFDQLS